MFCAHEVNLDVILETLIVADDLESVLIGLDPCIRSAIRLDACFHLADVVLHNERNGSEFRF